MTGLDILKYAVSRVIRQRNEALAASGLIWIATVAMQIVLFHFGQTITADSPDSQVTAFGFFCIIAIIFIMIGTCWAAVNWHRFILLGDRPTSAFPVWHSSSVFMYLRTSLKITILMSLFIMISFSVIFTILGPSAAQGVGGTIFFVLVLFPLVYAFYRVSPILPAAALGRKLSLKEAWALTQPHSSQIFQAAIFGIFAVFVLQLPSFILGTGIIGLLYGLASGWLVFIVGVSLLSAIYSLCTEGSI